MNQPTVSVAFPGAGGGLQQDGKWGRRRSTRPGVKRVGLATPDDMRLADAYALGREPDRAPFALCRRAGGLVRGVAQPSCYADVRTARSHGSDRRPGGGGAERVPAGRDFIPAG
jgi:hypothetical protein